MTTPCATAPAQTLCQDLEYTIAGSVLASMPGATVLDVGAERGSFIELALANGAARVHAFEPLPRHHAELARRFSHDARVRLHPMAVSENSGRACFHIAHDQTGKPVDYHHSLSVITGAENLDFTQTIEVETVSLADFCNRQPGGCAPGFIKLDTEGHDLSAISGLGDQRPEVVMCEFWNDLPETSGRCPYQLSDLTARAASFGYRDFLCVRHLDGATWLDIGASACSAREWGNVLFFRADLWPVLAPICVYPYVRSSSLGFIAAQVSAHQELVAKERVIQDLIRRLPST